MIGASISAIQKSVSSAIQTSFSFSESRIFTDYRIPRIVENPKILKEKPS